MELDLTQRRGIVAGMVILLLLLALGGLGAAFTPAGGQALTWTEWQVLKGQRAYQRELARLQAEAEALARLLSQRPDPVRSQLVAARIERLTSDGQPSLGYQREQLAAAAQAVRDWAVGAADYQTAQTALEKAVQVLTPLPTPEPTAISAAERQPPTAAGPAWISIFLPFLSKRR
jgi:hypothetical protein